MKRILFTDLDGTVLDRDDYSFESSLDAIDELKRRDIPIIFCSSKTKHEQEVYRWLMRVFDPFIVEDGSAIYIPRGYFESDFDYDHSMGPYLILELGTRYERIRECVADIERAFGIRSFGSMSVEDIADATGLSHDLAAVAKQRQYSETLLIGEEQEPMVSEAIDRSGLTMTRGSRFCIVRGKTDKGKAVGMLKEIYRKEFGEVESMAVGDGPNDLPMLENVEKPFLIRNGDIEDSELPDATVVESFDEILEDCI